MTWYAGLAAKCQPDAPLGELTWYQLGGRARWLFDVTDEAALAALLQRCAERGVAWRVLGRGANVIVRDRGVDGAVIRLAEPCFEQVEWTDAGVTAGAAVDFPKLVKSAATRGLGGIERLAGIPGTLGGIVRMNAGGKYGQIADFVDSVRLMTPDGICETHTAREIEFGYRHTRLDGAIVLGATLRLSPGDPETLLSEHRRIWLEKSADQPPLGARSAGCIFKNPPAGPAGKLIDAAGLKGTRVGQAEISTRHANFIVAYAGATAGDVLELALLAKERVRQQHGVELEFEVDVW